MSNALPPRIMIAKPGLDGHDRGAVVIVQALRDAGFDVIYTGLRRTPAQIAIAAAQEDVDVLGVSCMSGAHLALLEAITHELDALPWRPQLLMAGGVIPQQDRDAVAAMGYPIVLGPGTPMQQIRAAIARAVPQRMRREAANAPAWVRAAVQLTALERGETLTSPARRGRIILVAGQGGAGKSTLIGAMLRAAAERKMSIAVLANDPVSSVSQGSILADRLRMPADLDPAAAFIRSVPVRGRGSIADACPAMAEHLAAMHDLVLVETIGVAQNEPARADWADHTLAVIAPGIGDHWQLRKAAILETCDTVVLTKNDLPEAQRLRGELDQVLHDLRRERTPRIITSTAGDAAASDLLLGRLCG